MFRRILCFTVLLALSGCALPRSISSPEKIAQIKTVIVMPAMEEKLTLSYVGFTVFNNEKASLPVDWRFNDLLREEMTKALSPRYEIRPFTYDPAALAGAYNSDDATLGTADKTTKLLGAVAKPGLADAIIVLVSDRSASIGASRPQGTFIGTSYTMNVYDGQTLMPIAQSYGGIACRRGLCANGYQSMVEAASFRWLGEPPETAIKPHFEEIRSTAAKMLVESVPHTLGRLGLTPRLPSRQ